MLFNSMSIDRAELLRLRDRIKVIVFDLDGTLLNDEKIIPQENVDIIKQLQKAGIAFVIASGRHAHEVFSLLDSCGIKGIKYVICRDGQHIYDENKRRIKSFQYLNAKDIARLFTFSNCSNIFFLQRRKGLLNLPNYSATN